METLSIVICCYNSSKRIGNTLKYISELNIHNIKVEVILIDNASNDNTSNIAIEYWNSFKLDSEKISFVTYLESIPGLLNAKKKGVDVSSSKYLLFVDDDNWLDKEFLVNAFDIIAIYPRAAVLGGIGYPIFESENKPDWFNKFEGFYAVGEQFTSEGIITKSKGYVYGACSFWRTSVLKTIFESEMILTGRLGNKLSSGEDSEMCFKAILLGNDIVYSKKLVFSHFIPESRSHIDYIKKMQKDSIRSNILLHGYMYKVLDNNMFDKPYKRTWYGQLIVSFYKILSGKSQLNFNYLIFSYELIKLNKKYNKLFIYL